MKIGGLEDLFAQLRHGQRVFFQGGPGECLHLYEALKHNPGVAKGVEFWSCLIPGINTHDYGALPGDVRVVTFMASPAIEASVDTGRTRLMAMPYSDIGKLLSETAFDIVLLHTAPPDRAAQCSFGPSCDTPALVWKRAAMRVAFINRRMPALPGAESIPTSAIDLAIEIDEPLITPSSSPRASAALDAIGRQAAALVPEDAVIQSGIGDTPAAVVAALRLHRGLRVHSGIVTPEYQQLAESGALDIHARNVAGIGWGDAVFHAWLAQSGILLRSVRETHDASVLAGLERFVSIGSAIEIDLAGNLNLEWRLGRRISSIGGAGDFMAGAAASRGGRSIIALQAAGGGASRIVPKILTPTVSGALADTVVTEHGVAHLKGLRGRQRAEALIGIAAPEHRAFLAREIVT